MTARKWMLTWFAVNGVISLGFVWLNLARGQFPLGALPNAALSVTFAILAIHSNDTAHLRAAKGETK